MRAIQLLLLVLPAATGCGTDPLGPDFADDLSLFGGCADVTFYAVDSADRVMVTFRSQGLVAQAREVGHETSTRLDLPAAGVELVVEQGSRISDAICDDVIENSGPQIRRAWTAVSGSATVRIRPLQDPAGAVGDLLLEDVVFTTGGGGALTLERLEWLDISVGWYPG